MHTYDLMFYRTLQCLVLLIIYGGNVVLCTNIMYSLLAW